MITRSILLALLANLVGATIAHAAIISGSLTGLASADVELTFDEIILSSNGPIYDEYSSYGVTFQNAFYDVQGWNLPTGRHISNFSVDVTNPYLGITFAEHVSAAAFQLITNTASSTSSESGKTTIEAWLDGALVTSIVGDTFPDTQYFFGFTEFIFDEMRIYPGGWLNVGRLDNLQFQVATPLPAALPVFLLGLGIMRLVGRRN